jgi:hypothetical protein
MLIPLIIATWSLNPPAVSRVVCLVGHPSVTREFDNSALVFTGRVVREQLVPDSGQWLDGTTYTVQVAAVYRGQPGTELELFSENSSGRFPMAIGTTYLIFVSYRFGRYAIDYCGNSAALAQARQALKSVSSLTEIQRRKQPPNQRLLPTARSGSGRRG